MVIHLRFVRPLPGLNRSTEPLVGDPRYLKATVSSLSGVNRDQNRNQEKRSWEGITEGVERSGKTARIRSRALALKGELPPPLTTPHTERPHTSVHPLHRDLGLHGGVWAWFTDRRRTISESVNTQEVTGRDVGGAGYRFIDGGGGISCSNSLHSCLMSSTSSLVSGRCITMLTIRRSQALVNLCTSFATCTTHQFSPLPRSY